MNAQSIPAPSALPPPGAAGPAAARGLEYANVLRAFAALAVVMIHVSGQGVVHTELVSDRSWWVAIFFDASSRWSVSVFVMVSGALLLGSAKRETLGEFFQRRLIRIGIPFVFWCAAFLAWRRYYVPEPDLTLPKMARQMFYGIPAFHLYFLFLIFGLYFFTPMLRAFVRHASRAELWFTVVTALTLTALSQQLRILIGGWVQFTAFDYFVPYVGYFLAGHAIANTEIPETWLRWARRLAWVLLPVSIAVACLGVGQSRDATVLNNTVEMYFQFTYPTVIAMSLCVFFLGFDLYRTPGKLRRFVARICAWIAPAAFGVFLIHPMLLWEVFKRHGMPVYPSTIISCPAWSLALFTASLLITKLLQLIPGVRRLVG